MDFDSSAKFISSLAKFLQSLCNGYVEFDNGVEVIGHIYLSVDTGKKIDYVLNEKVCKTDENSVTFISNSFHAQPAEKPKPEEKPKQKAPPEEKDDIIVMDELDYSEQQHNSENVQNSNPLNKPPRSHGATKRSYNQSFSSHNRPSKMSKYDSSTTNSNSAHIPVNSSANDNSFNVSGNITAATESDLSHLSQVFPESINPSNTQSDIKPILDKDLNVIDVKQEYDPSADIHQEGGTYDEQGDPNYYSQDQSYESGNEYYGSGHQNSNQRSDQMYLGDGGAAGTTGDTQGTGRRRGKTFIKSQALWKPGMPCPVCLSVINHKRYDRHWNEQHERIVTKYLCPFCDAKFKRREKLVRHSLTRHGHTVGRTDMVEVQEVNCQFVDPTPLDLDTVLGIVYD